MTGLALATCDLAMPPGRAPESSLIDLPMDFEHQSENPDAKRSGPVPAAGWIKDLKTDDGGVWGRVEWTATEAELIGRKESRFLSPAFLFHPKTRHIVRLKGAGLVHNPNLHLTALANKADDMTFEPKAPAEVRPVAKTPAKATEPGRYARPAECLELTPDATEDDMMAALQAVLKRAMTPDPAKFVPVTTVQAMRAERNLSLATAFEEQAGQKVDDARRSGHMSPAKTDWASALHGQRGKI